MVAETAKKYGKFAGTTGNPDNIGEYAAMGYQFVNVASDVTVLARAYLQAVKKSKEAVK